MHTLLRRVLYIVVSVSMTLSAALPAGAAGLSRTTNSPVSAPAKAPDPLATVKSLLGDDPATRLLTEALAGSGADRQNAAPQGAAAAIPGDNGKSLPAPDLPQVPTANPQSPAPKEPNAPRPLMQPDLAPQGNTASADPGNHPNQSAPASATSSALAAFRLTLPAAVSDVSQSEPAEWFTPRSNSSSHSSNSTPVSVSAPQTAVGVQNAAHQIFLPIVSRNFALGAEYATVQPGRMTTANFANKQVALSVPAGAVSETLSVMFQRNAVTATSAHPHVVQSFELTALHGNQPVTRFNAALGLTIHYADQPGLNENLLHLYYFDEARKVWVGMPTQVDAANNRATASTTHFTLFALMDVMSCAEIVWDPLPAGIQPAFDAACQRVGLATLGQPKPNGISQLQGVWKADFDNAALIYNASQGTAYYVSWELYAQYIWTNGPNGLLGLPVADTDPNGPPDTFRDERHDFRHQPFSLFAHGFVGMTGGVAEAHRFFPKIAKVYKTGELVQDGVDANGNPINKVQISFGAEVDPSPDSPYMTTGQAAIHVVFGDGITWDNSAEVGPSSVSWQYPQLVPLTTTVAFAWALDRGVAAPADDLVGYAPCLFYDYQHPYGPMDVEGRYESTVSCAGGGGGSGDFTPPTIHFIEVWPDGNGNLSILAEIVDNSGALTSYAITGGPGELTTPLTPFPQAGANIYGAVFSNIPKGQVVNFTVTATDPSGNSASASGSSRSPFKGRYGLSCANPCGGYDTTAGDPVLLSTLGFVETQPIVQLPGPGASSINIALTYNGPNSEVGTVGQGWTFPYQMNLESHANPLLIGAQVTYPDGRMVTFSDNGDGTYSPVSPDIHDRLIKRGGQFVLITKSLTEYVFEANGHLSVINDPNGNAIRFTYSGDRLVHIENDSGRWVNISYNAAGYISALDAPEGKHYELGYTGTRLTSYTDALGKVWTFEYQEQPIGTLLDVHGQPYDATDYYLSAVKTPEGHYKNQQTYNSLGEVTSQLVGGREHRTFVRDETARTVTVTDAYSKYTVYRYDDKWRLIEIDYPDGTNECFGYDDNFNRIYRRDQAGQEWHWTYDAAGNRLTEDGPLGEHREWQYNDFNKVTLIRERVDSSTTRETTIKYDGHSNPTEVCNALHDCSTIVYNGRGLPTDVYDFAHKHAINTYAGNGDLMAVTNPAGETTHFTHDGAGRIVETRTPLGYVYSYAFDPADHLVAVDGPLGYHLGYRYDDNGNLEIAIDANGGETQYTHDTTEKITQVKNQLSFTTVYTYGQMSELVGFQDAKGRNWTYSHDAMLRLTDINGPLSTHVHFVYDAAGNVTDTTDAEGHTTHTDYDLLYRPISVTKNYEPSQPTSADTNVTTAYQYDLVGDVLSSTDPEGNSTYFEYDLLGRMTLKRTAEQQVWQYHYDPMGNLITLIDPLQHETDYEYDGAYRLWKVTDAKQGITTYHYDADGNLLDQIDALGVVTHYVNNERERPVQEIRNYKPGKPSDASTNVTTKYEYDPAGNLRFVTDPRGSRAAFRYDAAGRLTDKFDYEQGHTQFAYDHVNNLLSVTDDNLHVTSYVYDDLDHRVSVTNPENHTITFTFNKVGVLTNMMDANGNPTHFDLDGLGRVIHMVDALNGQWRYVYDRVGNILRETDANLHTRTFVFDKVYRLLSTTDAENNTTAFHWDADGNLIDQIDANQHVTHYAYDELHRLIALTNAENETTQYQYDPLGNQTGLIEADQTVTHYTYDPLYRLDGVTENYISGEPQTNDTNVVTHYVYDASGNLVQIINANGAITHFEYDGMGRLVREIDPLGNTWNYTYDGVGNQLTRLDANGALTKYTYYPDDQLHHIQYANGTFVDYAYDKNNNRTTMQDSLGTTTWVYDGLNRVTSVVDPFQRTLHYTYDPVGNRLGITYPDDRAVTYTYLKNNWLSSMTDPVGNVTTYQRDHVGNIARMLYPNSIVTTITYDRVNRTLTLVNQQTTGARKINSSFVYTYDKVGNVVQVINHYGWRQPADVTETYTYDGLHRLAGMQDTDGVVMSYTYDRVGNRLTWTTNDDLTTQTSHDGFSATYIYNAANQLTTANIVSDKPNGSLTVQFTYDPNGNRINQLSGDQHGPLYGTDYSYDPENRLAVAQDYQLVGGGNRVDRAITTLGYDGGGRRLVQAYDPKTGNGGEKRTEYTFDNLNPVAEYAILNGQYDNYYRGAQDRIVAMHNFQSGTQGQMYWYNYNFKGDVVGLSKQHGQSTHNYRYDPYGGVMPDNGNFTDPHNHYTLTGKEFDENTGLIYFGARHYDPKMVVWLTMDPYRGRLLQPGTLHRYEYAQDNPATLVDWYGFDSGACYNLPSPTGKEMQMSCEQLAEEIQKTITSLSKRYDEMISDKYILPKTKAICKANPELDSGHGTVEGHLMKFAEEQVHLGRLMQAWLEKGCGGGIGGDLNWDWKWAWNWQKKLAPVSLYSYSYSYSYLNIAQSIPSTATTQATAVQANNTSISAGTVIAGGALILGGILLAGGTVLEDILTAGFGAADDPATLGGAAIMIQQGAEKLSPMLNYGY